MQKSKKDKSLIQDKEIVLDTNILIEILHLKEFSEDFRDFIIKSNSAFFTIPPVFVELVNGLPKDQKIDKDSNNRLQKGISSITKFLKEIDINNESMHAIKMLAVLNAYVLANPKHFCEYNIDSPQPSFIDFFLGYLTFGNNVIFATLDHKACPEYLYDRLYLKTFDYGEQILNVGFYKINRDSYENLIKKIANLVKRKRPSASNCEVASRRHRLFRTP